MQKRKSDRSKRNASKDNTEALLKLKQERQHKKIQELLAQPDTHLEGVSEQWWDEFQAFLKEHRFNLR